MKKRNIPVILLLPLLSLSCSLSHKMERSISKVGLSQAGKRPAPDTTCYSVPEKITWKDSSGVEHIVTMAERDSVTGEEMTVLQLDEVTIVARNRNIPERAGKVNLDFVVTVPGRLIDDKWQVQLTPVAYKRGRRIELERIFLSGADFVKRQKKGYAQYQAFINSIIPDSAYLKEMFDMKGYRRAMAGLEEDPAPSAGPAPASEAPQHDSADDEDDEPQDTIPQALGRGVFGMFKWLLLVVLFVLIIAGGGVAWLYRSATPDMLPEVKVTFDGQELAPTAYKWHVPVVGSFFRRTYAETLNSSPVVLEDAISDASPDIIVTPSDYSTQLTITDADKETVYEGSATGFRSYLFAENGTFDAKLVVTASDSAAEDRSSVTGTETWQFRFTVSIKPSVTLCTPTVQQGSVAAVRVGSTMSRTEPTLTGPLESTGFVRAANGWICYLPIPWNAETGNTELTVTADGYTETLTLSVRAASYSYKDYSTKSQLTSPYIGADDAPDAVRRLLTTDGGEIQWAVGGFVQPFLDSFDTPLMVAHLRELRAGHPVQVPVYDYTIHNRSDKTVTVQPAPVIIVEGILIFDSPELCDLMDMKVFVDTDADMRILRRIVRDVKERGRTLDSVVNQYLTTVKPMHEQFVEPSKRKADLIVPEGGHNLVALELLIKWVDNHLHAVEAE